MVVVEDAARVVVAVGVLLARVPQDVTVMESRMVVVNNRGRTWIIRGQSGQTAKLA